MRRVLFVCVENSCRSQMAEGWARKLHPDWEVRSGGSKPSGSVNLLAVLAMKEAGIDISGQTSKGLPEPSDGEWDLLVTMGCGDACPNVPAKARVDWDIPDPKGLSLDRFFEVRDEIARRVREL